MGIGKGRGHMNTLSAVWTVTIVTVSKWLVGSGIVNINISTKVYYMQLPSASRVTRK